MLTLRKKFVNKWPNCIIQETKKQEQTKPKVTTEKEVTKTRAEINEI